MSSVTKKYDDVINGIEFDSEITKQIFESRLLKFIDNDSLEKNKIEILNIVQKINWFRSKEINDYIINKAKNIIDSKTALYQFKPKATSSSTYLISLIAEEGLCLDMQVLCKDEIQTELDKFDKLIIVDDYIGSGQTIIDKLYEIKQYLEGKKIIILSCVCQNKAKEKIDELKETHIFDIELISKHYLDSYLEYLEETTQKYVSMICEGCIDETIKYGWNNIGALVAINEVAPNNNISMLWNHQIKYNNNKWFPLLSRELCFDSWNKRNKELINKNSIELRKYYQNQFEKRYKKYGISYNEFQFLVYSYGCYLTPKELVENGYFQDINEYNSFIERMRNFELVDLKHDYLIIKSEKLYKDIRDLTRSLYNLNNKFKKNTNDNI